jgi:predicted transcriptional regulator of viral defense system
VRVAFFARKRITEVPVQSFNTPRGAIQVSTPEATALDLVGYADHAGGLGRIGTVLSELAERIDPAKLAAAAETAPITWGQRLGYLLDHFGFEAKTKPLKDYVRRHAKQSVPKAPHKRARNKSWKLYVNAKVEADAVRREV